MNETKRIWYKKEKRKRRSKLAFVCFLFAARKM